MLRLLTSAALTTLAVVSLSAFVGSAQAADRDGSPVEMHIKVYTVDFNSPAQVKAVYRHITADAEYVCDAEGAFETAAEEARRRQCVASTVSAAVNSLDRPLLSRLDDRQIGRSETHLAQAAGGR